MRNSKGYSEKLPFANFLSTFIVANQVNNFMNPSVGDTVGLS